MSFVSVLIPKDLEAVEAAERSIPAVMGRLVSDRPRRRFFRPGEVLDLIAFDSEEEYEAAAALAAPDLEEYHRALGVTPEAKFWNSIHHSVGVDQFPVSTPGVENSVMMAVEYKTIGLDVVQQVEKDNPEIMDGFVKALQGNGLLSHSRFHRPGQVMDFDEFASEEGCLRFCEEADGLIREYNAISGDETWGTVWYTASNPSS